jgi:hypothetical protein
MGRETGIQKLLCCRIVERPNTPPGDDTSPHNSLMAGQCDPGEEEDEEKEQAIDEAFILPPSTAPAMMQLSRAGRKRAPTLKTLEAQEAPKQGRSQGRGRRGYRGGRRLRG